MIVTPETHKLAHVYLDGQDVSGDCFYADDEAGMVRMYRRNQNGHIYVRGTKADPEWQPGKWPEAKQYRRSESGAVFVTWPLPPFGEAATEERHGTVRIELPA